MNLFKTGILMAGMTALFMGIGFLMGREQGMLLALVFASGMNLFTYWNADKMVLRMNGAREVSPSEAPDFHRMVARLAANADLPMPKVYIIDNPQPNAFATGRNPQNAAVAATTGLLRHLSPDEVEGVMAHELAHVKNRDTSQIIGLSDDPNIAYLLTNVGRDKAVVVEYDIAARKQKEVLFEHKLFDATQVVLNRYPGNGFGHLLGIGYAGVRRAGVDVNQLMAYTAPVCLGDGLQTPRQPTALVAANDDHRHIDAGRIWVHVDQFR